MKQTESNKTTQLILGYLLKKGVYAWRNSVASNGIYQFGKVGSSDIFALLPPNGRFVGIEIKTGKDRLRPEQVGFIKNVQHVGAYCITVKDFDDFVTQFELIPSL